MRSRALHSGTVGCFVNTDSTVMILERHDLDKWECLKVLTK